VAHIHTTHTISFAHTHTHIHTGGDGLFMVVDEGGIFREDNFQKAVTQLNDAGADGGC